MKIEPLSVIEVNGIHEDILNTSPGLPGICPHRSLESALKRIDNHITYGTVKDLFEIAAFLAIALAQGHVFIDGNKRTALLSTYTFLRLNGYDFKAPESEATNMMVDIAEKKITHTALSVWLKKHSERMKSPV